MSRQPVPERETPEQTFKRLIEPRVMKVVKACKQIGNCARFKPTAEQRVKVFTALKEAMMKAERAWQGEQTEKFEL